MIPPSAVGVATVLLAQPAVATTGHAERTPQLWLDASVANLREALGSPAFIQIGALAITVAAAVAVTLSRHRPVRPRREPVPPGPLERC